MSRDPIENPEIVKKVLDTLPVGVWIMDAQGRLIHGNPAAQKIWGGARYVDIPEYKDYKGWWASTGKRIEAEEWAAARAIQKGETSLNEEIIIETFDGGLKTILNSAAPIHDEDGRIIGGFVVNEEITGRKRIETELIRTKEVLEKVFSSIDLHIAYLDRDLNFIRVNRAYAEADGRPQEFFTGKNHFALYPNPEVEAIFRRVIDTGEPVTVYGRPFTYPEQPERGVTWWDWSLQPVRDETGSITGLIFSLIDVTEHKRVEEELKLHKERLEELVGERTAELKKIVAAHERSERWLRQVSVALRERVRMLDLAHIMVLDPGGKVRYWNRGCEELYGWKRREAYGKNVHDFLKTGFPVPIEDILLELDAKGDWQGELTHTRKDGERIIVSSHWALHRDRSGKAVSIIEVNNDITGLKSLEEKYRGLYESIMDGIVRTDMAGNILECNRAYREILGYTDEEIKRLSYQDITPARFEARIFEEEMLKRGFSDEYEKEYIRKDGAVIPASLKAWLVRDASGRPSGVWAIVRDITERKRSDEALKSSELKFRTTAEAAADAVICIEPPDRITFWNRKAEEIFGYTIKEAIGRNLHEIVVPEKDRERYKRGLADFFEAGKGPLVGRTTEVVAMRKDGTAFPAELSIGSMQIGGRWQAVGVVRDITERKSMEEALRSAKEGLEEKVAERTAELERSNRDLEQFAYIASHDLQEPLRMISSYLQLLSRNYKGKLDEDADEFIKYAVEGAYRMERMIYDLLEYSRVQSRAKPSELIHMTKVVAQALENLKVVIKESGAEIASDPLPRIHADPAQMARVFQNLIGNAIKFRKPDTPLKVQISSQERDSDWLFSVKDNGIGIEPEYAEKIFQIFQRLHGRKYPGTGMGLAICRRIVERHGGEIRVESAPGEGAVFYFSIPKAHGQGGRA